MTTDLRLLYQDYKNPTLLLLDKGYYKTVEDGFRSEATFSITLDQAHVSCRLMKPCMEIHC